MIGSAAVAIVMVCLWMCFGAAASEVWPDLSQPTTRRGGGEGDAAVVVAIEDYVDIPSVSGAKDNAGDWYLWFTESRRTPVDRVYLLRDREATRERILDVAARAADQVEPSGTLWFVFIGHGAPSRDGTDGLLLGWDTQQTALSVYERGITQTELLDALGSHSPTVVLLDACFSGRAGSGAALVEGLQPVVPNYSVNSPAATLLTAAETDQFAGPLPGSARPAFSYLLLGALRGWADVDQNGRITAGEAMTYTTKAMRTLIKDRSQTPVGYGPGKDTTLARGTERGPDLAKIVMAVERVGTRPTTLAIPEPRERPVAATDIGLPDPETSSIRDVRDLAKVEWDSLWATPATPQQRQEMLAAYVAKYDKVGVNIGDRVVGIEIEEVSRARRMLKRAKAKATVGFLGGFGLGAGAADSVDYGHGMGTMSFILALHGKTRRAVSLHHLLHGGIGLGSVAMDEATFGAPIMLGASQFISGAAPSGHRPGVLFSEGLDIFVRSGEGGPVGAGDGGNFPAIDLRLQFALWFSNDFFFSIGAQFMLAMLNTGSGVLPLPIGGIIFQSGGIQFQM